MIAHAVLRVRGPALHITVAGHPSLAHNGEGESIWTVALEQQHLYGLLNALNAQGVPFEYLPSLPSTQMPQGRHDACQFCAYYDALSEHQCGVSDWDAGTLAALAQTPDGQNSLERCPENHSPPSSPCRTDAR